MNRTARAAWYLAFCSLFWMVVPAIAQLNTDPAQTVGTNPSIFGQVRFDQRLGDTIPLNTGFLDEHGQPAMLRQFFTHGPVILALTYYRCPMLCPQLLDGLVRAVRPLNFEAGKDYNVVVLSIDPDDSAALAATKHEAYTVMYGRPGAENGWHFLTGKEPQIRQLTDAVGFHYAYDPASRQYAHASGIIILTQQGVLSQYTYGVSFSERDVRLGLIRASQHRIGSLVDQVILYCYHYDPLTGKYGALISHVLQIAGGITVLFMAVMVFLLFRNENYGGASTEPRAKQPRTAGAIQ